VRLARRGWRRVRVAAALAATALVVFAFSLPARANVPSSNYVGAAKYEGRWYWRVHRHETIPCSRVQIRFDHFADVLGRRSWYALTWPPYGCSIHFNRRLKWWWSRLATTMVHEYGHVVGHRHTRDPRSIMALGVIDNGDLSPVTYPWRAGGEPVWWSVPSRPWGCTNPAGYDFCQ
jgi:hypothetical protein